MLTYHFPPMGGAGVQRSSKFVRYLPDFGYRPVVIASPGAATDRFTPHDAPLARSLPPGTEVHRVPGPEPPISGGRRRRAERWAGLPSPFGRWWTAGARELGLRVGREADVDLVYASIMPFESGIAGVEVARGLGRPLVVDLRDAWAIDELQVYPSAVHRAIEARRMRLRPERRRRRGHEHARGGPAGRWSASPSSQRSACSPSATASTRGSSRAPFPSAPTRAFQDRAHRDALHGAGFSPRAEHDGAPAACGAPHRT